MRRIVRITIIMILALVLGACSVKSVDSGAAGVSDDDPVEIDNPFDSNGEEEDLLPEGGSSGGTVTPTQTSTPSTPQSDGSLEIVTTGLANCYQHFDYYQKLEAQGGSGYYEWTVSGLPEGISGSKYISGTTTADPGNYVVNVTVKDAQGEESVSKNFDLKVVEHVKEDLIIVAYQYIDYGQWPNGDPKGPSEWKNLNAKEGHIEAVTLDMEKRRIKLMVAKPAMPQVAIPTASRFYWDVKAADNRLSIFVPPAGEGEDSKEGQIAYLAPWFEAQDLELGILDIINDGIDFVDTEITVHDEFGNKAKLTIGKLDFEKTKFSQCNQLTKGQKKLVVNIDDPDHYNVDRLAGKTNDKGEVVDDPGISQLTVSGGVGPYKWRIGEGDAAITSLSTDQLEVSQGIHSLVEMKCGADSGTEIKGLEDCTQATLTWKNIVLQVPDIYSLSAKLPVKVTDACGNFFEGESEMVVEWPKDPIKEGGLYASALMYEACHTNPHTNLYFHLHEAKGKAELVQVKFALDPVPCDDVPMWYDSNGNVWVHLHPETISHYPIVTIGTDAESKLSFDKLLYIQAHTHDTGEPWMDLEFIGVHLLSPHWSYSWNDGVDGLIGEGVGAAIHELHVHNPEHIWKPRWEVIPPSRKTF